MAGLINLMARRLTCLQPELRRGSPWIWPSRPAPPLPSPPLGTAEARSCLLPETWEGRERTAYTVQEGQSMSIRGNGELWEKGARLWWALILCQQGPNPCGSKGFSNVITVTQPEAAWKEGPWIEALQSKFILTRLPLCVTFKHLDFQHLNLRAPLLTLQLSKNITAVFIHSGHSLTLVEYLLCARNQ